MKSISAFFSASFLAVTFLILNPSSMAQAADRVPPSSPELVNFFRGIEDTWRGRGLERELQTDGSWKQTRYELELEVDSERGDSWRARSEARTEESVTRYGDTLFEVRGELLYISSVGPHDPVAPLVSTPTQLSYCFDRAQLYTGRVFHICEDYRTLGRNHLLGRLRVELNGALIHESEYDLTRR